MSIESIRRKFGAFFERGGEKWSYLKSGIFMFDLLTGGFPIGKISLLWGKKSSGKSFTVLKTIATAQKLCRHCLKINCDCKKREDFEIVYVDVEGGWNPEWAKKIGIDTDRVYIYRPTSAEEAVDVVNEIIKSEAAHLICIDSIASLEPMDEEKRLAAEWTQGLMARILGKAVRKWLCSLNQLYINKKQLATLIVVNQSRYKIGHVTSDTMPGGVALSFGCSLEVKFWSEKPKMEGKLPEYVTVGFQVEKSRISTPFVAGQFKIIVMDDVLQGKKSGEVFEEEDVLSFALKIGLVKNTKGGYCFEGLDKKFKTQDEIIDYFIDNKDFFAKIKEELLAKRMVLLL